MLTHTVKKVELFIEKPQLKRVVTLIQECGARRYTVIPAQEGRGLDGAWQDDLPVDAQHMVQVVVLTRPKKAEALLEGLAPILESWPGVVCVSDVQVMRLERF
jgi:hypothetical protein